MNPTLRRIIEEAKELHRASLKDFTVLSASVTRTGWTPRLIMRWANGWSTHLRQWGIT